MLVTNNEFMAKLPCNAHTYKKGAKVTILFMATFWGRNKNVKIFVGTNGPLFILKDSTHTIFCYSSALVVLMLRQDFLWLKGDLPK